MKGIGGLGRWQLRLMKDIYVYAMYYGFSMGMVYLRCTCSCLLILTLVFLFICTIKQNLESIKSHNLINPTQYTQTTMLNYHELTMNEPRDSPQRRKQFLVICVIMIITTLHSALSAGLLSSMSITTDTFPSSNGNGGEFVYKLMNKDYAASTGTVRTISSDLNIVEDGTQSNLIIAEDTEGKVVTDTADLLYSIYLDDASLVPGGQTRFVSGVLLSSKVLGSGSSKEMKKQLLNVNSKILADNDKKKKSESLHSKDVLYEIGNLPKVNAAVMTHPFTAGAMSAILQSYKVSCLF